MRIDIATALMAGLFAITGVAIAGDGANRVYEEAKVANFALPGHDDRSPGFEGLSFWSGPHGQAVDYEYGPNHKRLRLRTLGPGAGGKGFAVGFPNGFVLDIVPLGGALQVRDRSGRYGKTFQWRYEGPVDGRGTFCQPCVDEPDAIGFVREHFTK
jgi:hypothetical protein